MLLGIFLEKVLRAAYGDPAMGIQAGMVSAHALLSDTGLLNFLSACETCVVSQDHRSMSMRTPQ